MVYGITSVKLSFRLELQEISFTVVVTIQDLVKILIFVSIHDS